MALSAVELRARLASHHCGPFDVGLSGNKRMADGLRRIADGFDRAEGEGCVSAVWHPRGGRDPDTGGTMDELLPGSATNLRGHVYRITWDDFAVWDYMRACAALCVTAREALGEAWIARLHHLNRKLLDEALPQARGLCELGLMRWDVNYPVSDRELRVFEGEGYWPENEQVKRALEDYGKMGWSVGDIGLVPDARLSDMSGWARHAADYLERHWNGKDGSYAPDHPKNWNTAPAGGYGGGAIGG